MQQGPPALDGVLETVLYHKPEQGDAMRSFYRDVLGLRSITDTPNAYRVGSQVFLLFNSDESSVQDEPPAHGATGAVHTCFVTGPGSYDEWKRHFGAHGVGIVQETTWPSGVKSFYFHDPAGNVLEIANGDLWPT